MAKEFYSTTEVAAILRTSRITIFNWIKKKKLKAIKIGRNYVVSHEALLEALGKAIGKEKKAAIEKAVSKALKDYRETFKLLGRE